MGERDDEPARGGLDDVVGDVAEVEAGEVGAAGDDERAPRRGDQSGRRGARRRELRAQAAREHRVPAGRSALPERPRELRADVALVAAPRVRDDEVEAAVLLLGHAGEQRGDAVVVGVVGRGGDPAPAAGRDGLGGVVDGAGPGRLRARRARRAPGHVDRRAAVAESERDAATDPPARPRDDCDAPAQVGRPPGHSRPGVSAAARPAPARWGTPTRPGCAAPGGR